jgi:hypothetical protein
MAIENKTRVSVPTLDRLPVGNEIGHEGILTATRSNCSSEFHLQPGLPDVLHIFEPKIPRVNFGGPWHEKSSYMFFMAICNR